MKELLAQANQIQAELANWLKKKQGKKLVRVNYKILDAIQLLRLKVWAQRHYLELTEVFDILIPVLQSRVKVKYAGLGISVKALTGPAAYRILCEEITKLYPANEHIMLWKLKRQKQLQNALVDDELATKAKSRSVLAFEDTDAFVASFGRKAREKVQVVRRYRWNPYI
jgi:hypothetical protein